MMKRWIFGSILLASTISAYASNEFRGFNAIPTPSNPTGLASSIEPGYTRSPALQPLAGDVIENGVRKIFDSWNTPELKLLLTDSFPNKSSLLDAITAGVPGHVRLNILSIQNPRTIEQYQRPHPDGDGSIQVLSKIAVQVRVEVAASKSFDRRFQRLEGTSEYVIRVVQKVR